MPGGGKKGKTVFSVEQIFESVSNQKVYGVCPPIPRVVLTPRSSEALLQTGVDVEELRVRDLDSFWEPGIDPKVQRLRHEDYSTRRRDLIMEVRLARTKIVRDQEALGNSSVSSKTKKKKGKKQPVVGVNAEDADEGLSTLIEQEEARLKRIQLRKKQEIEQILAFEMRQLELQEETQAKLRAEEERVAKVKAEVERRKREQMEQQRMKELQRQAQLEFEDKQRRRIAEEAFRKEKELAEKKRLEEQERQREAMRKQMERDQKAQARREQTELILKRQQQSIEKRRREAAEKERKRIAKLEKQNARRAKQLEEKQRRAKQRIELNRSMLEESERRKAEEIRLKEEIARERARRLRDLQEEEFRRKNMEIQLMEEKRKRAIEDAKREEELRAMDLLSRQEQVDAALNKINENKERNLAIQKEQQRLRIEAKLRNAERMKKKQEYKKMQIAQKLEEDAKRIDNMLKRKKDLVQKRKAAAIQAKIKRDVITNAMQKIKQQKNFDKADKLLEQINSDGGLPSKKNKKKKKRFMKVSQSSVELTPYEKEKAAKAIAIRTAKKMENKSNGKYISPYERQSIEFEYEQKMEAAERMRSSVVPAFANVNTYEDGSVNF